MGGGFPVAPAQGFRKVPQERKGLRREILTGNGRSVYPPRSDR